MNELFPTARTSLSAFEKWEAVQSGALLEDWKGEGTPPEERRQEASSLQNEGKRSASFEEQEGGEKEGALSFMERGRGERFIRRMDAKEDPPEKRKRARPSEARGDRAYRMLFAKRVRICVDMHDRLLPGMHDAHSEQACCKAFPIQRNKTT